MIKKSKVGVYVHIPFCAGKCPYCDFYSVAPLDSLCDTYTKRLLNEMEQFEGEGVCGDTLYFGGGTPLLLGTENLLRVIKKVRQCFCIDDTSEITIEVNPSVALSEQLLPLQTLREAGVNRLSIGMQSALEDELHLLGRKHSHNDTLETLRLARKAGFSNISLDLMLGIPNQTSSSLSENLRFCIDSGVSHVSTYLLKREPGTPFFDRKNLNLPDEDTVCDLYLQTVDTLESANLRQYEISNFAHAGKKSRHNLKYWNCEEYIGLGSAAHSFYNNERYFHSRSLTDTTKFPDGNGGDYEEYAMLVLRLRKGLTEKESLLRYGISIPLSYRKKAEALMAHGFVLSDKEGIRITPKGFLLSNSIIAELLVE